MWLIQIYCIDNSKVASISVSPPASSKPVFGLVGSWRSVNVIEPELTALAVNTKSRPIGFRLGSTSLYYVMASNPFSMV